MNIVKLHQLVDQWAAEERAIEEGNQPALQEETEVEVAPRTDGKSVAKTKTSGDRVYLLDSVNKTRQWVTNPDILTALGFTMADVSELDEAEFLKYQMGPAIYKLPDGQA